MFSNYLCILLESLGRNSSKKAELPTFIERSKTIITKNHEDQLKNATKEYRVKIPCPKCSHFFTKTPGEAPIKWMRWKNLQKVRRVGGRRSWTKGELRLGEKKLKQVSRVN